MAPKGAIVVSSLFYRSKAERKASMRSEIVFSFMASFLWSFSSLECCICLLATLAMTFLSSDTRKVLSGRDIFSSVRRFIRLLAKVRDLSRLLPSPSGSITLALYQVPSLKSAGFFAR